MMDENYTPFQINRLYEEFFERGLKYFFPFATFRPIGSDAEVNGDGIDGNAETSVLSLTALGSRYAFQNNVAFTEYGLRMLESVSAVLTARYRMLRDADRNGLDVERFGGLPEDRYVSAFLDPRPYSDKSQSRPDRVADAIEVLRTSALTTYENRRISTGALLFGTSPDPCHDLPSSPPDHVRYSSALTRARSFHRLSDGLNTLALVDQDGCFVDVIDVANDAERLIAPSDLLASTPSQQPPSGHFSKDQFHYLLRDKRLLDLPTTILETIARIDGAVVLDGDANLLAFGAILHYPNL